VCTCVLGECCRRKNVEQIIKNAKNAQERGNLKIVLKRYKSVHQIPRSGDTVWMSDIYIILGEIWTCGFGDMLTERQTHSHAILSRKMPKN